MSDEAKIEATRVNFPPDLIRFANIYKPIKFYHPDSREQFTFIIAFDKAKVFYSAGADALTPFVYHSTRFGPQLRLKSFSRPPVLTPGVPATWLAHVINILDAQNRKRDDVFQYADTIEVAVRPWNMIARFGPHEGEMITGLSIDHVDLHGLTPEKLEPHVDSYHYPEKQEP